MMTTTPMPDRRRARVDLDVGTAPDGTPVLWQLQSARGQARHGLILDHDAERRRRTQTLIAQRARAATGAHIARLDETWGRRTDVMWRDLAADSGRERPLVILIDSDQAGWWGALPLWLLLSRLGPDHRISLVVGLSHLGSLTTLEEPRLTSALTGRSGQWLLVGSDVGECRCRYEVPRHLPGATVTAAPGEALYRGRGGAPQLFALHAPDEQKAEEEFRCAACEQWGEWVMGQHVAEGAARDEYACSHCRQITALRECERRTV